MKQCTKCGEEKPISHYTQSQTNKWCRRCRNEYATNWRVRNLERTQEISRDSAWRANLKKYGLTEDQYYQMLEDQDGVCLICGKAPDLDSTRNTRLCVDHDHTTGKVRGLLCNTCNRVLGMVKDNTTTLHSMIEYLGGDSEV